MSYVDLHCHILPGLDDGRARSLTTVRFARRLDAEDVLDVACTPHIKRARFPELDLSELASCAPLRARSAPGLDVTAAPGGELAHEDALELAEGELRLIAQGPEHAPWLLLECPLRGDRRPSTPPSTASPRLGYGLLLAQPERRGGRRAPRPHVEAGALLQVNVSSAARRPGPRARGLATGAGASGRAYCLASDAHPGIREATLPRGIDAVRRAGRQRGPRVPAHAVQPALPAARGRCHAWRSQQQRSAPTEPAEGTFGHSDGWTGVFRRSSTR